MVEAVFVLDRAVLVRRYSLEKGPAPNAAADAAVSGRGAASPSVGAAAPAATAAGLEIQDEILWDEPDRMLKLELPTALAQASYVGQGAFGRSSLPSDGSEAVAKRWVAAVGSVSSAGGADADAVLVYTDSGYGSDFSSGTIRLNLLRTAAYSAHPIKDRPLLSEDRVSPRMDRGVRHFSFRIECGQAALLDGADRRGLERGEKPRAVSFFPPGQGAAAKAGCVLEGPLVLSALKRAEADDGWIFRVYDAAGAGGSGTIKSPALGVGPFSVRCGPWEVRTYKLGDGGSFAEVGLME
jgi:alpha-mannosidase